MSRRKALSRRTFLRGGGAIVALPFLDAMIPTFAYGAVAQPMRFIVAFNGSVGGKLAVPTAKGALPTVLPEAYKALSSLRQHISIISNLQIPVYNSGLGEAFIPGGSHSGQHGFSRGPILSGMGSYESMLVHQACKTSKEPGNQTCDQYAAHAFKSSTMEYPSLELKVQAVPYNGNPTASNGSMSARKEGGLVSALLPMVSPVAIYNNLFADLTGTTPAPPSSMLVREKSVLDLVLGDATRLSNSLYGDDKARLELHFEEIRKMERAIASQISGGSGGGGSTCTKPTAPPADTPPSSMGFGGWANETLRGQLQADMIAYAIGCDLKRVVSWMITHDQCWLNSNKVSGSTVTPNNGGVPDIHSDSHSATAQIVAANCNWHAELFARLINNLLNKSDAGGPLLNNTFLSLVSAEGNSAHSRSGYVQVIAGNGGKINLGQHIDAGGAHPARLQITGLQSIGVNMSNTMGQVTGTISGVAK